jgi:type II restriction enzyme
MTTDETEAKRRLDALINKARADLYKPMAMAEILHRHRNGDLDSLEDKELYRRRSYSWMLEALRQVADKTTQLNSRYWDQTFDEEVIPPRVLAMLGEMNRKHDGIVEVYIYGALRRTVEGILAVQAQLREQDPLSFDLDELLRYFEHDRRYARSIDRVYEVTVYALFSAVTEELKATVTLSVAPDKIGLLEDFADFSRVVLGLSPDQPSITKPARLYRVGAANSADAGLDMWANFGPAVQVKHVTLAPVVAQNICSELRADELVIVCRDCDAPSIEAVVAQLGLHERLRGVLTRSDLVRWYAAACDKKYHDSLGKRLLNAFAQELLTEFPIANRIDDFLHSRGYDLSVLKGVWAPPVP